MNVTDMRTLNFPEIFQKFQADEAKPRTKAELIAYLKSEGDNFASYLETLPEPFLAEPVTMPPGATRRRRAGSKCCWRKEHEMHHRGQLMTLQRMIGQVPHLTRLMQERMAAAQAATVAQAQR